MPKTDESKVKRVEDIESKHWVGMGDKELEFTILFLETTKTTDCLKGHPVTCPIFIIIIYLYYFHLKVY